jgi:Ni/Co efflux regulator RcnB
MRAITASILAGVLVLGATAPAFADPPRYNNGRYSDRDYRDGRWDNRRDYRGNDWRRYNGKGWYDNRGKHHKWNKGDRFNHNHYNRFAVVDHHYYRDHRGYRLPPPRYGERYYRNNDTGEILLIAAATGLVLWALNN